MYFLIECLFELLIGSLHSKHGDCQPCKMSAVHIVFTFIHRNQLVRNQNNQSNPISKTVDSVWSQMNM